MMKIIKLIKMHRNLRIRQEVLCHKVVTWSWLENPRRYEPCPEFEEFRSVNRAVHRVETKLPNIYFVLSDLLGGSANLKKKADKIKYGVK